MFKMSGSPIHDPLDVTDSSTAEYQLPVSDKKFYNVSINNQAVIKINVYKKTLSQKPNLNQFPSKLTVPSHLV